MGSGDDPGVVEGETTSFALEFASITTLTRVPRSLRTHDALGEDRYRVCGRVDVPTGRLTVVGAFAARRVECGDDFLKVGDWSATEVSLGVDPFTYQTFHAASAGELDITRAWTIESIHAQVDGVGPWSPVESTARDASVPYLLGILPANANSPVEPG